MFKTLDQLELQYGWPVRGAPAITARFNFLLQF